MTQPPQLHHLLAAGQSLLAANRLPDAERHFRNAVAQYPQEPAAHHSLGVALIHLQRHAEAFGSFEKSLQLQPTAEAYLNLIQLHTFSGQKARAVVLARAATAAFPTDLRIVAELVRALDRAGDPDEALLACQTGLVKFPNAPLLVMHAGNLLFTRGDVAQAVAIYRSCLAAHPAESKIHSVLLFSLHFLAGTTPDDLLAEHMEWNRRHALPLAAQTKPHTHSRIPDRPLRIGYVSPDFRNHGVGRFIAPLLEHHTKTHYQTFAYADVHTPDALTHRVRDAVQTYRQTTHLNDAQLVDLIRSDQIDILVDLAMHMPSNRLLAFARRPAPIQISYLAYCSTTGLTAIDYRITDPFLDPPAAMAGGKRYSEESIPIPSYWCYEAPLEGAAIPLRGLRDPAAPITFGCLNNFAKVSPLALETWAAILRRVPHSHLLLHAPEGSIRQQITQNLGRLQIAPERLQFAGRLPLAGYLQLHVQCDLALDPFPYNGGTTTCDALYMGTPVITLAPPPDALAISRAGVSLLSQLDLKQLIAPGIAEYIQLAASLAQDADRLIELRRSLRPKMQRSPLMNGRQFNDSLEAAYRTVWHRWCSAK